MMAHYRAYIMDSDGHISKAVDLIVKDDAEAMEAAKQLVDGHDVELWEHERRISLLKRQESP
ncbi:MAG: hypothetical protein QOD11_1331 [Bradyrhizobium sp.]|jgi:hypothetical protein|nr:hypothetical protein [Bradyrhizobium sp.]